MSRSRTRSGLAALAAIAAAATVAGCGFGAGPGTRNASIQVTSAFGSHLIGRAVERHVPGSETVMWLLERHFQVTTRYGGGFVESIDGHSGGSSHLDWFYYVNGIEAPAGRGGDGRAQGRPHLVGPARLGSDRLDPGGRRLVPGAVHQRRPAARSFRHCSNCGADVQAACDRIGTTLHRAGVKAADQVLGTGSGSDSLAVVVGTWREIKGVIAAELIDAGPGNSGVYAQFIGLEGPGA